MPKMTCRGTTKMNRNCNRRAEEPSAQAERCSALRPAERCSALHPAERCSALLTPDAVRRYIP
jgi:hypothetical protein